MVSAIVCAYNEEKTIGPILEVLLSHPKIDEVIAVDDGSTDRTGKIIDSIKSDKLVKIHHPKNLGKGAAVASAVKASRGKFLLFADADLINFHPLHVDLLLSPLLIEPNCMVIGLTELKHAYEKWATRPVYVLLVGDATIDYKDLSGNGVNNAVKSYVPAYLFNYIGIGEVPSDNWFVDVNDDILPDMNIGRIPAKFPDDVSSVVSKIMSHEKSINKSKNVVLIADDDDPRFEGL